MSLRQEEPKVVRDLLLLQEQSNFKFPKSNRLLTSTEFEAHKSQSFSIRNNGFHLVYKKIESGRKLGVVVSKRFGNAVNRNRIKRAIREFFRGKFTHFDGYSFVFIAKSDFNSSKDEITTSLEDLYQRLNERLS
jgi:ribonuclease P protein component